MLPLTQQGAQRETVETMIADLQAAGQQDILALGYGFAALVFTEEAQRQWLKWRFETMQEILSESWAYRDIMQRGIDQGREQGRIEELRSFITRHVGKRYPELTSLARQQVMFVHTLERLETMLDSLIEAQTTQEARRILLTTEPQTS